MKVVLPFVIFVTTWLPQVISQQQALFIKRDVFDNGKRVTRQTSADQMVQNILQWLQGVYTQNSRRIRQGSFREYLPPSNTQKPRPFEPPSQSTEDNFIGYPPAGSITPQPPFTFGTSPPSGYPTPNPEITPPDQKPGFPGVSTITPEKPSTGGYPGYPSGGFSTTQPTPGYPEQTTGYPTRPTPGYPGTGYPTQPTPGYPGANTGYPGANTGYPTQPTPGYPGASTGYPTQATPGYPGANTGYPTQPTPGYPGGSTGYPTQPTPGYPGPSTGYPTQPTPGYPGPTTGFPTGYPGPTQPPVTGYPTQSPSTGYQTQPPVTGYPTQPPITSYPTGPTTGFPTQPPPSSGYPGSTPGFPTGRPTYPPQTLPTEGYTTLSPSYSGSTFPAVTRPPGTQQPITEYPTTGEPSFTSKPITEDNNIIPTERPSRPGDNVPGETETEEDLKHPPHIHAIDVECAKDMMTINIEFNRQFDGVIYSKGFYSNPECRYVKENSGQIKYSFTVSLNSCGTEFINGFDTEGKSYLENVLVLQNEPGIQEVWDTIRSVRCLWEGNLNKALSVALSVGMLNQEIVTFSGDTAMARLDIQLGKGPFAPPASGLVKIGEVMTLVVSVSGDPGFDIQVKDCRAKDSTGEHVVALTDDNGCVLKPKLFGAFQKTRNTGNTGASIIAYAFFNAFKFPDVMDLMLECNVELCKTDCEVCPDPNQKLEPGRRRRREIYSYNDTIGDSVTMGKMLRVILPEDLSDSKTIINLGQNDGVCMSTHGFVFSSALLISLLTCSCLFSAYLWLKNQHLSLKK